MYQCSSHCLTCSLSQFQESPLTGKSTASMLIARGERCFAHCMGAQEREGQSL